MKHNINAIFFITLTITLVSIYKADIEIQDYEQEHMDYLRDNAPECALFLQRGNDAFPLKKPGTVLLVGSGARNTYKGGTGSGDVYSRFYSTCEKGLEKAGFKIVSKDWLDEFPKFKKDKYQDLVDYITQIAKASESNWGHVLWGYVQPEAEYDLPLEDYKADVAIYVLGRNSGEGNDRNAIKGDFLLTDSEIRDILYLNNNYEKFLLVLNVAGIVDLSPIRTVANILLLSELGVVTGDVFADIVLGKSNPSGKLSSTWARIKDYKFFDEFGKTHDTRYVEGVYVGYRYFDSERIKPIFPFGFGLSYTTFKSKKVSISNEKEEITIETRVSNIGKYPGKEVIQVYISPSQENMDKPYQTLVAFQKTRLLDEDEDQRLTIKFKLSDIARYDVKTASWVLDKGNYIIRVGSSSDFTTVYGAINLDEDIVLQKVKNVGGKPDFGDYKPNKIEYDEDIEDLEVIYLTQDDFPKAKTVKYEYEEPINEELEDLEPEKLTKVCLMNIKEKNKPKNAIVPGAAGETTRYVKEVKDAISLVDGPAGLRITQSYCVDEDKNQVECTDDTEKIYQYTTAIPIATALGQTFNVKMVQKIGDLVGSEMDMFNAHLWLAPALNIHRSPLCGRNFEYFSEDPLISGKMAAAITLGVQKHKNRGTTIKHFACNNQEWNRFNSNSVVSERALREIYLKGFEIAIKESNPISLMTSYNLINGVHSSERKDLIYDVLRSEWKYEGLIMSDWYSSTDVKIGASIHPSQNAARNIENGNNLQMGGGQSDYDVVMKAYEEGKVTKDHLLRCASKVYETILLLHQK